MERRSTKRTRGAATAGADELLRRGATTTAVAEPDAQRLETVGRLATGIAHDFNNLLSVILSCSSELEEGIGDPELRERASEIRSAAERGAKLTGQLLGYARPGSEELEPIDVNRAVLDTARLLTRVLGEQVTLTAEPAAGLPQVLLSPGQIEQILINLAANSRDAMPEGGSVLITTRLVEAGPDEGKPRAGWHVELSVSDDGPGMDPDDLARAGEPFFTTKRIGGTGLGLATVYEIARGAGGAVRIASTAGEGTNVSIYLPAVDRTGRTLGATPRVSEGGRA